MSATITILSPHRDDAVFSLALCIGRWMNAGAEVKVVNFFTESAYAPRAITADHSNGFLSSLRKREDCLALRRLHPEIGIRDLGMTDAPVRRGVQTGTVSGPAAIEVWEEDVCAVMRKIHDLPLCTLWMAPLGLGNHVDHRTVREAALDMGVPGKLGFYEDLPYATWTSEEQLNEIVRDVETRTGCLLRPRLIRKPKNILPKRRLALTYQTQIAPEDADVIARFAGKRGGERIWIPRHSGVFHRGLI